MWRRIFHKGRCNPIHKLNHSTMNTQQTTRKSTNNPMHYPVYPRPQKTPCTLLRNLHLITLKKWKIWLTHSNFIYLDSVLTSCCFPAILYNQMLSQIITLKGLNYWAEAHKWLHTLVRPLPKKKELEVWIIYVHLPCAEVQFILFKRMGTARIKL